jgi:hypothetical protein
VDEKNNEWLQWLALLGLVAFTMWFVFVFLPTQHNGQNQGLNYTEGIVQYKTQQDLNYVVGLKDDSGETIGQWKCFSMAVCAKLQKGDRIRFTPSPAGYIIGYSVITPKP